VRADRVGFAHPDRDHTSADRDGHAIADTDRDC
jgi:hypothetical protein